jgi:shikimate kinase
MVQNIEMLCHLEKPIILIGLMGSGKTTIGSRLAKRLDLPFIDTDEEVERQVGCSIANIFKYEGEDFFRKAEYKIVKKILAKEPCIIATGGGAFINPAIRQLIDNFGISIWLRASLEVLLNRVVRRKTRPILEEGDKKQILQELIATRYPIYLESDITIDSDNFPHNMVVDSIITALDQYIKQNA